MVSHCRLRMFLRSLRHVSRKKALRKLESPVGNYFAYKTKSWRKNMTDSVFLRTLSLFLFYTFSVPKFKTANLTCQTIGSQ